ncbi:MAG: hypothetical protein Kapaf2KO_12400 [Candidatus Kapaibacteriales bacterium]
MAQSMSMDSLYKSDPTQGNRTTIEQDEAYRRALLLDIPIDVQLRYDLLQSQMNWFLIEEMRKGESLGQAYLNVMDLPDRVFQPEGAEVMQRRQMLVDAFSVPGIYTYAPNPGLFTFEEAARFLGLAEDFTPKISYTLSEPNYVEIVIYSTQAKVIATLFQGKQPAGGHSLTWNLRDQMGRKMPAGDYVAEIRIGNERYYRKIIKIK